MLFGLNGWWCFAYTTLLLFTDGTLHRTTYIKRTMWWLLWQICVKSQHRTVSEKNESHNNKCRCVVQNIKSLYGNAWDNKTLTHTRGVRSIGPNESVDFRKITLLWNLTIKYTLKCNKTTTVFRYKKKQTSCTIVWDSADGNRFSVNRGKKTHNNNHQSCNDFLYVACPST